METYAELCGEELWNSARLRAYLKAGIKPPGVDVNACTACDGLPEALACEDETGQTVTPVYTTPSDPDNPAPWYDPADPASADFAGLLILGVEGWEVAPYTRAVQEKLTHGAVLGRGRYGPRTIVVTALLIGRTCCSLQAGLRWLSEATVPSCEGCGGCELDYFECCPGVAGDCSRLDQGGTAEDFAEHRRQLRQAGITEGVRVVEKVGRGCGQCRTGCAYMQVEFTITASDPFTYGPERTFCDRQQFLPSEQDDSCVVFVKGGDDGCADPCASPLCPVTDPACPVPPQPPGMPLLVGCGCEPLSTAGSCCTIPADAVPDWQAFVPSIEIYSGSQALRGVKVRFYENPLERPVEDLDDCDVCTEFIVSYIQPGATFRMDGRDRKFTMDCNERETNNASRLVSGVDGKPFTWPVLSCGGAYTVCVTADATTAAPDAYWSLSGHSRSAA